MEHFIQLMKKEEVAIPSVHPFFLKLLKLFNGITEMRVKK